MGALSFNYTVFPKPKISTKFFEYRWSTPLSEYRFEYEKYAALSDASIFNAPVAVTKVATGVCLYDLFVVKDKKDTDYLSYLQPAKHIVTGGIDKGVFLYKVIGPIPWTSEVLQDAHDNHTIYMPNSFEVIEARFDFTAQESVMYPFLPPDWKADTVEFTMERIPYEPGKFNWFYQEGINRLYPYYKVSLNEMETILNEEKPARMRLHFMYRVERTNHGDFSIYPNETAIRIKNDNLEIFEHGQNLFAWGYDYRVINYYENFNVFHDTRFNMERYENVLTNREVYDICIDEPFNASKDIPEVILIDSPLFIGQHDYHTNIASLQHQIGLREKRVYHKTDGVIVSPQDKHTFVANGHNVSRPDRFTGDMNGFSISPTDKNTSDMNGLIGTARPDLEANIIEQINLIKKNLLTSVLGNDIFINRLFYKTSILEQPYYGCKGVDGRFSVIFSPDNTFGSLIEKHLYYQSYIYSGRKNKQSAFYTGDDLATRFDKDIFESDGCHLMKEKEVICELSLTDFGVHERKYAFTLDGIHGYQNNKDVSEFHTIWVNGHSKSAITHSAQVGLIKQPSNVFDEEWLRLGAGKIQSGSTPLEPDIFFGEKDIPSGTYDMSIFGLGDKQLSYFPPYALVGTVKAGAGKDTAWYKDMVTFGAKGDKLLNIHLPMIPVHKEEVSIIIWPDQDSPVKSKYRFEIQYTGEIIHKSRHPIYFNDSGDLITKIRHGMSVHDCDTSIYKQRKGINLDIAILWSAYKVRHSMVLSSSGTSIYKVPKDLLMDNAGNIIHKTRHPMSVIPVVDGSHKVAHDFSIRENFESAIKTAYKVAVSHYIKYPNWERYGGFIVPISKVRHQAMIDYVNEFAKKRYRNTMITEGSFASVLAKPGMLEPGITIDKLARPAFIDYLNEMLVKTRFKAAIEEGTFGAKTPHNASWQYEEPWGYMNPKPVQIDTGKWLGKDGTIKGRLDEDEWLSKGPKPLMISQGEFAYKAPLQAEVFDDEWLRKAPLLCYYSYDLWGIKDKSKAFLTPQEIAAQNIKEVQIDGYLMGSKDRAQAMIQFGDFAARDISNAWYEYGVFADRLIRASSIANELDGAFKDAHKCDLHPNDFGNWAWVYETPDPFQYDKYGIDELLLPEKDTQYENFEDLIFDREHMRPRNAIKEISDTQWIARLPIRHPVDKWQDVGKVYEDSAIKWENYFGIQSSVIHDMFLKYYRIWEKYMFQFSTMTMQQAGNLMLEYLWSWIPDYYPLDQIEQAYRAFRLVRWYTECAIINNSQYIISYEYANLAWPDADHKGICHIPSDLQEYDPTNTIDNSNDTMYSDTAPGHLCLRNNPIYTRSNDVWVTFRIKNKRNTTITLSLYNQVGSVNIYLNDNLIDTIYARGSQKLAYSIPYTGDTNEFKVEKKATDNLDNNFIIGNISIDSQGFKDLKIDFDPALRAGNKPLNEVAQKLLQFAALHDRKDIAYHEMLTKNLAVSEVYKMLAKYWQLHHEDKWKGKRLTIKQV